MTGGPYDAVLVLSFGGPEGPQDVVPFLQRVTRGRDIPADRLAAVATHYELFGGVSPINAANRALIAALRTELRRHGPDLPVYWGNRNWHPLVADTVRTMRDDGVRRALCFATSAFAGYSSCRQYLEDLAAARRDVGEDAPLIDKIGPYFDHPGFVGPLADGATAALARLPAEERGRAHLVCCAHSVPMTQASTTDYATQVTGTARRVAAAVPGAHPWSVAWQSRSGPPNQPWLEPDVSDHLESLAAGGVRAVVLVPVGFVADHLEVIYDLDRVAAERAAELGVTLVRSATPGTDPRFVTMIRELVAEPGRVDPGRPWLARTCAADCCPAPVTPRAGPGGRPAPEG